MSITKTSKRDRRHKKIAAKVRGTAERPRLSVYRSNKGIHVQLIDDVNRVTLLGLRSDLLDGSNPTEKASVAGTKIADLAKGKKIKKVVFDRGGFMYAGQVRAFAESARKAGLDF